MCLRSLAVHPTLAIKYNQARRFGVMAFDDARAASIRFQPIEKPCYQDCAGTIDAIESRQIDLNGRTPTETRLGILHSPHHRYRMDQVERTRQH